MTRGQAYPAVDRLLGLPLVPTSWHTNRSEDPETAAVMNALYVNIKGRSRAPDLDKDHQTAHQLLARRPGGWPLTLFLTPDDHSAFSPALFASSHGNGLPAFHECCTRSNAPTANSVQRSPSRTLRCDAPAAARHDASPAASRMTHR